MSVPNVTLDSFISPASGCVLATYQHPNPHKIHVATIAVRQSAAKSDTSRSPRLEYKTRTRGEKTDRKSILAVLSARSSTQLTASDQSPALSAYLPTRTATDTSRRTDRAANLRPPTTKMLREAALDENACPRPRRLVPSTSGASSACNAPATYAPPSPPSPPCDRSPLHPIHPAHLLSTAKTAPAHPGLARLWPRRPPSASSTARSRECRQASVRASGAGRRRDSVRASLDSSGTGESATISVRVPTPARVVLDQELAPRTARPSPALNPPLTRTRPPAPDSALEVSAPQAPRSPVVRRARTRTRPYPTGHASRPPPPRSFDTRIASAAPRLALLDCTLSVPPCAADLPRLRTGPGPDSPAPLLSSEPSRTHLACALLQTHGSPRAADSTLRLAETTPKPPAATSARERLDAARARTISVRKPDDVSSSPHTSRSSAPCAIAPAARAGRCLRVAAPRRVDGGHERSSRVSLALRYCAPASIPPRPPSADPPAAPASHRTPSPARTSPAALPHPARLLPRERPPDFARVSCEHAARAEAETREPLEPSPARTSPPALSARTRSRLLQTGGATPLAPVGHGEPPHAPCRPQVSSDPAASARLLPRRRPRDFAQAFSARPLASPANLTRHSARTEPATQEPRASTPTPS
ncbi:hypothetical protein B0H10DRAFT_2221796 [Mycena sp. CBHHK59/15]|nr:hypothetical protein B0H10DRAFT_2221796 [Mycena sp. CBHHK59/15]